MFGRRTPKDIVLNALARDLSRLYGRWRVDGDHLRGPGSTAVTLSWKHNETMPNHIDIGFVLDVEAAELEVVWDCVVGLGETQKDALERGARTWTETTGSALLEMVTQRGDYATNLGPDDPDGLPGFHTVHGRVLAFGRGEPALLQNWVLDNSLLPQLARTLVPHLNDTGVNGVKLFFGGVRGDESVEVRVNGVVRPEPTEALAGIDWPRLDEPAFVRVFVLAHRV